MNLDEFVFSTRWQRRCVQATVHTVVSWCIDHMKNVHTYTKFSIRDSVIHCVSNHGLEMNINRAKPGWCLSRDHDYCWQWLEWHNEYIGIHTKERYQATGTCSTTQTHSLWQFHGKTREGTNSTRYKIFDFSSFAAKAHGTQRTQKNPKLNNTDVAVNFSKWVPWPRNR